MNSTSFSFPRVGEREPLLSQNTGEDVKPLSRLDALLSDAREVVQRNTRLLLIVASQAFFSVIGAIVKILHKVDPLMQVPLKFQYQLLPQYPDLPHELFTIRMITTYIIYMCVVNVNFVSPGFHRINV